MKNSIIIFLLMAFLFTNCKEKQSEKSEIQKVEKTEKSVSEFSPEIAGACSLCGCMSWRTDSGEPEKCINIKAPTRALCQHSKSEHESKVNNEIEISFYDTEKEELVFEKVLISENNDKSTNENGENTKISAETEATMYCLEWVRDEWGNYNGTRARFSVWKPKRNSGFGCCVIVNISRNGRIIARQRVTVTNSRHIRILIGTVNGVSQGVSPC
jgi:hypothetical protein